MTLNPSKAEIAALPRTAEVSFIPMDAVGDDGTLNLARSRSIGDVENGYTYFRDGDVTFAKITPCFENGKGALMRGMIGGIGFGTTELTVARPIRDQMTPDYLHWLFRSSAFREEGEASMYGAGGQKRVPDDFVRELLWALPSLVEQEAIASFLDRETAKIDALIAEQEKLLALLAEKRQATISHAVTRGLQANAPMKDSGIPWIGMVPRHWDVVALKRLGWLKGGSGFPHEEQGSQEGELEFHKVASLGMADANGVLGPVQDHVSRETAARLGAYVFPRGTIVFAKVGAALMLGRICLLREVSCIDNNMMGFVVSDENCVQYVRQAMTLVRFDLLANPGAVPSVNGEQIGNFLLPRPPVEEQREVARFLASETAKMTAAEDEVRRSVALLRERRSSIITAAVTGQIDVRAATA